MIQLVNSTGEDIVIEAGEAVDLLDERTYYKGELAILRAKEVSERRDEPLSVRDMVGEAR